jgi:hypothetical protein
MAKNQRPLQDTRLKAIAEALIFAGADVNAFDNLNWAPVHLASKSKSLATIRWMVSVNHVLQQLNMRQFDF